jgi:hypothetical protein
MSRLMLAALLAAIPFAASAEMPEVLAAGKICERVSGDVLICAMKHPLPGVSPSEVAGWILDGCERKGKIRLEDMSKCPERLAYIKQRWGGQP